MAAVTDGMDGIVARRGRSSSFGENLDSLADAVSFCTVPALLVADTLLGAAEGLLFLLAGLLRLARFNVEIPETGFQGLPSTGAGVVLVLTMVSGYGYLAPLIAAATAPLMVSSLPYTKPTGYRAVPLGVLLVLAAAFPGTALSIFPRFLLLLSLIYVATGPVEHLWSKTDLRWSK